MNITIAGSVAIDTIKTPFGEAADILGGSATYSAFAAGLFAQARIISVAGKDFPEKYMQKFKNRGIDIAGLKICRGSTFRWTGHYGENINEARTISVCPENLKDASLEIPEHYAASDFLFLANTDPEVQSQVLQKIPAARLIALDTMNLWITNKLKHLKDLLRQIDILFINETESKMLSGKINPVSAAKEISKAGPETVVVKKGEHGALLLNKGDFFAIPAYPMERVKDPTGAGDSFAGGFLGYLASAKTRMTKMAMRRATVFGTLVASFAVEDFGTAKIENIVRRDVETRMEEMRRMLRF